MAIEVTPNSIIHGLPVAEWRGEVFPPYDVAGFSFSHRQAEASFFGIDESAHIWGGMNSTPMQFRLYFLNTLLPNAFPDKWSIWQELLFDGNPGKLKHPLRGKIDAVVMDGDVKLEAKTTAGVIVDVRFSSTLVDPNKAQSQAIIDVSVAAVAAAAKDAIDNADLNFPSGEPVTDLFDILAQLDSFLYSLDLSMQGMLNQWEGKLSRFIDIIHGQSVGTKNWAAGTLLIQLWNICEDRRAMLTGGNARPTAHGVTASSTTIDAIARERGNTVGEIMGLNRSLLGSSYVPKGTSYLYYTS